MSETKQDENETKQNVNIISIMFGLGIVFICSLIVFAIYIAITSHPPNTTTGKIAWEINGLRSEVMMGDSRLKEDVAGTFNSIAALLGAGIAITPDSVGYVEITNGTYPNMTIYLLWGSEIRVAYYNGTYHIIVTPPSGSKEAIPP